MEQQYLIDSNVVIDYLSGKIPEKGMLFMNGIIDDIPNVSVISKIEVLGYKTTPEVYRLLSGFFKDSIVLGLSDSVVEQTIELRKRYKIKTPDAIIAATAIVNQLKLLSRNTKDFEKIKGLDVLNPYDM